MERPDPEVMRAIVAEFERIGLPLGDMPGLAMELGAEHGFLAQLRRLPTGASWWDVFPDLPPDWSPEREREAAGRGWPEPIGPFDDLFPHGVAVVAHGDPAVLGPAWPAAVAELRARGLPVHGAGVVEDTPHLFSGGVVLEPGAPAAAVEEVERWLASRPGVYNLWIPRGDGGGA